MDDQIDRYGFLTKTLFPLACLVVIIAGIRAAASIIVPLLLAVFIAVVLMPAFLGLQKLRIRPGIAMVIIVMGLLFLGFLIYRIMNQSIQSFITKLPDYQDTLYAYKDKIVEWLNKKGADALSDSLNEYVKPDKMAGYAAGIASSLSQLVSQAAMILLIVIFLLFEAAILPRKLKAMSDLNTESIERLHQMVETIRKYLGYKTLVCLSSSAFITIWLLITKQSYAIPLGMLSFLLNYVPNIGSAIAAIPAILIALIEKGVGSAALCSLGYLVANLVIESILEPRLLGRSFGLSPAFILITMVLWSWILGPVGMLLAVPLTMMVKIFLQSHPQTEWLSILIGSSPERKLEEKSADEKQPVDG